jgi:hypothetical protein
MSGVAAVIATAAVAVGVIVAAEGEEDDGPLRAAVIDQLSLSAPNPAFVEAATTRLEVAGYNVDYYPGEAVTVDFYRHLPSYSYDLIVLRVHSGQDAETDANGTVTRELDSVSLSTGEPWVSAKYPQEQARRLLGRFTYRDPRLGERPLFGAPASFFREAASGRFDGTLVIMMGCDGLATEGLAQAFLDRGAGAFVGWTDDVTANHTDEATVDLLANLLVHRFDVEEAVTRTAASVGPDRTFGAELQVRRR